MWYTCKLAFRSGKDSILKTRPQPHRSEWMKLRKTASPVLYTPWALQYLSQRGAWGRRKHCGIDCFHSFFRTIEICDTSALGFERHEVPLILSTQPYFRNSIEEPKCYLEKSISEAVNCMIATLLPTSAVPAHTTTLMMGSSRQMLWWGWCHSALWTVKSGWKSHIFGTTRLYSPILQDWRRKPKVWKTVMIPWS